MTSQPMTIIHIKDGWYVVNAETSETISGPYEIFTDAVEAVTSHAYRLSWGWKI